MHDPADNADVTALLARWRAGEPAALAHLMPKVYRELRRLAARAMRGERADHTLEPTALVHEVYLRLAHGSAPDWRDRVHFYAVAARLMRHILVDHARALGAVRRGGGVARVPLEANDAATESPLLELLALDRALCALAAIRPRQARVVELRFFGGLSVEETAGLLGVSRQTVVLDTRLARAWLFAQMQRRAAA